MQSTGAIRLASMKVSTFEYDSQKVTSLLLNNSFLSCCRKDVTFTWFCVSRWASMEVPRNWTVAGHPRDSITEHFH